MKLPTALGSMAIATAPRPLLSVRNVVCQRGGRALFQPVCFEVHTGCIVRVRGPNGRGKTTLLRTLAGLAAPVAGQIVRQARSEPGAAPAHALYVGHASALKGDLSAAESLRFLLALSGMRVDAGRIDAALARMGVAQSSRALVRTLSQGQRRRVALARLAVPGGARTWLLDEPFEALDTEGVAALDALIAEHAKGGGGAVIASHLEHSTDGRHATIVDLREPENQHAFEPA